MGKYGRYCFMGRENSMYRVIINMNIYVYLCRFFDYSNLNWLSNEGILVC